VDDVARGEREARRNARTAGGAVTDARAGLGQFRPRGPVDCAADAAARRQALVGRVDDCVDVEPRDVALMDFDVKYPVGRHDTSFLGCKTRGQEN